MISSDFMFKVYNNFCLFWLKGGFDGTVFLDFPLKVKILSILA